MIIEQPWDSKAFGLMAGSLVFDGAAELVSIPELESAMRHASERDFSFVSCRLPVTAVGTIHQLENSGFRFVEMIISPWISSDQLTNSISASKMVAEPATEGETEEILLAIPGLYTHGRLHVDPRIPSSVGDRRYQNWIVSSTAEKRANLLSIKGPDGEVQAFFLFELQPKQEKTLWLLNAMMPKFMGRNLARHCWSAAIQHHVSNGSREIETTISLSNVPAISLYSGLGFSFREPAVTMHWLRL